MRTLKLTIAYDGTDYAGWQVQSGQRTIQGVLQETLQQILQEPVSILGSGRTDAGVHALGQVAHLRTRSTMPTLRLLRSLAALLPNDIAVMRVEEAPPTFHAQYQVASKRYRYQLTTALVTTPFQRRYVYQVFWRLNLAAMRREVRRLMGRHDVRAFQKASRVVKDTRRGILDASFRTRRSGLITIEVEATGFLYGMMRNMVGTVLAVGRGKLPEGTIARALRTGRRDLCGPPVPACGLMLVSVKYGAFLTRSATRVEGRPPESAGQAGRIARRRR